MAARSARFSFLEKYDPVLGSLGAQAERYVDDDPNTALIKLRQFGEKLALHVAETLGVEVLEEDGFHGLLEKLWERGALPKVVAGAFHALRREGNRAVHEHRGTAQEAAEQLENARNLAVWFHQLQGSENPRAPAGARAGEKSASKRAPGRAAASKKQAAARKRPAAASKKRAATSTKQAAANRKRAAASKQAAATKKQAAANNKQTAAAKKKAVAAKKKAAAAKKKATAAKKKQAAAKKKAAAAKKKQAAAKKKQAAAKKKQAAAKKKATAAKKSSTGKKRPARKAGGKKRSPAKTRNAAKNKNGLAGLASAVANWLRG